MKTNLTNLMSILSEEEKKFSDYLLNLRKLAYTSEIQELDGTINVTQDFKSDFDEAFADCKSIQKRITKLKSVISEKNNEFKLEDGRTIQEAIYDNTNLRKLKTLYNTLIPLRDSKERVTEVHNSYFECKKVNFDLKTLKKDNW